MEKLSPSPRVPDLRTKLQEQRAAATSRTHTRTTPGKAPTSASGPKATGVRSTPVTASETGDSSRAKKNPEAASSRKRRRGKGESFAAPSEASPSAGPIPLVPGDDDAAPLSASASPSTPSADILSERRQKRIEKARKRARKSASDRRRRKRNREALEKAQAGQAAAAAASTSLVVTFTGEEERTPSKTSTFGARDVRLTDAASSSSGPTPPAAPRRRITRPSLQASSPHGRQHRSSNAPSKPSLGVMKWLTLHSQPPNARLHSRALS